MPGMLLINDLSVCFDDHNFLFYKACFRAVILESDTCSNLYLLPSQTRELDLKVHTSALS